MPNVIDAGRFQAVVPADTPPLKILTVGRLTTQKRQDRFIRLIARLQQEAPGLAEGVIAGDGPLRKELEMQAMEAGLLPGQLTFLGKVSHMQAVYASASVFVLTSDWEGTPNVVMEAMCCGLPVVATDSGGVSDLIEHQSTGLLVDKDDESGLFLAVKRLLLDPALRESLGSSARAAISGKHSTALLAEYLQALYMRLLHIWHA